MFPDRLLGRRAIEGPNGIRHAEFLSFVPLQTLRRVESGRPSPQFLESAAKQEAGAYAGVSSAMRPSLQPYLASKSAFTAAAS